jgi:hypothetical protein
MYQRNFKSIHGSKRPRTRWKIPWEEKNLWGNWRHRFFGSWIHPRTWIFHEGTQKIATKGSKGALHRLFLTEGKKWVWRGKFHVGGVKNTGTGPSGFHNRTVRFWLDSWSIPFDVQVLLRIIEKLERLEPMIGGLDTHWENIAHKR